MALCTFRRLHEKIATNFQNLPLDDARQPRYRIQRGNTKTKNSELKKKLRAKKKQHRRAFFFVSARHDTHTLRMTDVK